MNIEQIKEFDSKKLGYLGERLKAIRLELIELDDTKDKRFSPFSMTNVAERLNLDRTALANVERGGSITNSIKVMLYYYSLGYNLGWILVPDNEFISMRNVGENMVFQENVREDFSEMSKTIIEALESFKSNL